ncbi:MAG: molybdopterin-binding protein [Gracilibacteraceae bacterium]|nr:molybdopterin-binding protein [Gracilibacteraceae bacterium]
MKKVKVEDSLGLELCHDMTKVVPGEFKGAAFKRGHIIRAEDLPELLSMGKEHIYVWEDNAGEIHEDDAAVRLAAAVAGEHVRCSAPEEGKSVLTAAGKGLFRLHSELLSEINAVPDVTIPCLPRNFSVEGGQKVASARIVPLVTQEKNILRVETLCRENGPVFSVQPYRPLRAALVVTGSEVYKGLIEDKFAPVLRQKLAGFEAEIISTAYCPDDRDLIREAILAAVAAAAELVLVTGGMSVDPDDLTPGAIKSTGAEIVAHGLPAQPGNMFLAAYLGDVPVFGVPGAAIYLSVTVLDVLLPRIFAGDRLEKKDLARLAEGGLCAGCAVCNYPYCYFGR